MRTDHNIDTIDTLTLDLPAWPGPIERQVMRELDHTETLGALREAHDALRRRRT